jgi:tetratricopeptide (TPR) repeat protein
MDDAGRALARIRALSDLGRFDEAASLASAATATWPDDGRAWCSLSWALLNLGQFDKALQAAQRATAVQPELDWAHRLVALAYSRKRRPAQAVPAAREAVRLAPDSYRAYTVLAQALALDRASAEEALEAARTAIRMAPDQLDAYLTLGQVALQVGRTEDAEQAYTFVLQLDPDNAIALNNLTVARQRRPVSPWHMADIAAGFAQASAADPRRDLVRLNVDATMLVVLAQNSLLLALAGLTTWLVSVVTTSRLGLLLPLAILALTLVRDVLFVGLLPSAVRRYLPRFARQGWAAGTLALEALAVVLLASTPFVSHAWVGALGGAAAACAFVAGLVIGPARRTIEQRGEEQ